MGDRCRCLPKVMALLRLEVVALQLEVALLLEAADELDEYVEESTFLQFRPKLPVHDLPKHKLAE